MKDIGDFSTEELQEEITRRKSPKVTRPAMIVEPNLGYLCSYLENQVGKWSVKGEVGDDDPEYIFEEVMKTFYGPDFFEWFNKLDSK